MRFVLIFLIDHRPLCRVPHRIADYPKLSKHVVMFYRCDKLRRAICLLGVMLTLSPAMQGVHAFCQLSGCASDSSLESVAEHQCSNHGCSHSHRDHALTSNTSHDGCEEEPSGSSNSPCPCPPTCWSHQAPEPQELPKGAPVPAESLVQDGIFLNATLLDTSRNEQQSRIGALASLDASAMSAAEICVQLCRFLA